MQIKSAALYEEHDYSAVQAVFAAGGAGLETSEPVPTGVTVVVAADDDWSPLWLAAALLLSPAVDFLVFQAAGPGLLPLSDEAALVDATAVASVALEVGVDDEAPALAVPSPSRFAVDFLRVVHAAGGPDFAVLPPLDALPLVIVAPLATAALVGDGGTWPLAPATATDASLSAAIDRRVFHVAGPDGAVPLLSLLLFRPDSAVPTADGAAPVELRLGFDDAVVAPSLFGSAIVTAFRLVRGFGNSDASHVLIDSGSGRYFPPWPTPSPVPRAFRVVHGAFWPLLPSDSIAVRCGGGTE